jgi:hypothetical protein
MRRRHRCRMKAQRLPLAEVAILREANQVAHQLDDRATREDLSVRLIRFQGSSRVFILPIVVCVPLKPLDFVAG